VDEAPDLGDGTPGRNRRAWFGLVLGVALLVAGAGAWLLGQPPQKATARVLGDNRPVNAGAQDRRDISANNSPALARNPTDPANLVVANRIDLPRYSCALHVSTNGGASFEDTQVPFPAGEEEPARCYAPDVAYSPDGTLHLSYVTLKGQGNVPNAIWTVSSKDGGRTLSEPVRASGPLAFQVQLTADPNQADRLYLNWLQAEATGNLLFPNTGNPIVSSTSTDGGATWSASTRVSPPSRARVVAPSPALGPKGELYVLYLDLLGDRLDYAGAHEGRGGDPYDGPWALVLARSTDHGASWDETLIDDGIRPTERFVVFLPPTPTLAVDPRSGRIYAAFTDGRLGDADVQLWSSGDGGKTFGRPLRVNDTEAHDGTAQYLPRVDVAPGGRVDVVYYDRRADVTNIHNEVSLQSSFDGARTFSSRVRLSDRAFDSRIGPGSERKLPDLGTRLALISTNRRVLAVWPDSRAGTELTSKQDLASAVVDVPGPAGQPRGWLRGLGAVAALLGLVSLAVTWRRRRSLPVVLALDLDPSVARPASAPKPRRSRSEPVAPVVPFPSPPPTPTSPPPYAPTSDPILAHEPVEGPEVADGPEPRTATNAPVPIEPLDALDPVHPAPAVLQPGEVAPSPTPPEVQGGATSPAPPASPPEPVPPEPVPPEHGGTGEGPAGNGDRSDDRSPQDSPGPSEVRRPDT